MSKTKWKRSGNSVLTTLLIPAVSLAVLVAFNRCGLKTQKIILEDKEDHGPVPLPDTNQQKVSSDSGIVVAAAAAGVTATPTAAPIMYFAEGSTYCTSCHNPIQSSGGWQNAATIAGWQALGLEEIIKQVEDNKMPAPSGFADSAKKAAFLKMARALPKPIVTLAPKPPPVVIAGKPISVVANTLTVTGPSDTAAVEQGLVRALEFSVSASTSVTVTLGIPVLTGTGLFGKFLDANGAEISNVAATATPKKVILQLKTGMADPTTAAAICPGSTVPATMPVKFTPTGSTAVDVPVTLSSSPMCVVRVFATGADTTKPLIPKDITVPIGTKLVIANPVDIQEVARFHLGGTGFAHQGTASMNKNMGYCPQTNNPAHAIDLTAPNYAACTAACAAGMKATIYDHNDGAAAHGGASTITCK